MTSNFSTSRRKALKLGLAATLAARVTAISNDLNGLTSTVAAPFRRSASC